MGLGRHPTFDPQMPHGLPWANHATPPTPTPALSRGAESAEVDPRTGFGGLGFTVGFRVRVWLAVVLLALAVRHVRTRHNLWFDLVGACFVYGSFFVCLWFVRHLFVAHLWPPLLFTCCSVDVGLWSSVCRVVDASLVVALLFVSLADSSLCAVVGLMLYDTQAWASVFG